MFIHSFYYDKILLVIFMDFIKDINEKTILVVPSNIKNRVLEYINNLDSLVQFKMYSLTEIKKYVYFDYDVDAILYLMDKYHYVYEVAHDYIENLYYIEDKEYKEEKLRFLRDLKKELDDNNLLKYNDLFVKSYKNTPFIVFGYPYLSSFDKKVLANFNYELIENKSINDKLNVYKFTTLEEEVLFVVNKIIELINNKVDINNIYLVNLDSDYNSEIVKLFKMFNIPVDINTSSSVLSTSFGKKVFNCLEESRSLETTLEYMNTFDLTNSYNQSIYKTVLNVFNKYNGYDYSMDSIISAIKYELLNKSIDNNNLSNMVRVGDISSYYDDNSYVFLLGFNQGSMPRVFKDEDYINDKLKQVVGLDSVNVINKLEKESLINNIKSIKNIIITFKEYYLDKYFYPSNLLNESLFNLVEEESLDTDYSEVYSNIILGNMLDQLVNYDTKDDKLGLYYNSIDTKYMTFDNKFTGLDKNKFKKYIDNKLVLSYTAIDTYYRCAFRYYIGNILKVDKYEESFDAFIGTLFHYVLSCVYKSGFDLDREYDNYIKDKEFSNKEKFYLKKLKKELRLICNRLSEFQNDTLLTEVFTEKNIRVDKSTDVNVIFKGIVDKIMYKEIDNMTYVSIIDYKTGHAEINLTNAIHGIGMQLIVYLYLICKNGLFNNYTCVGFYLQKILNKEVKIDKNKTYLELKNEDLKLLGYSIDDQESLSKFDPTYVESKYIASMKLNADGTFSRYAKVLSKETMNKLIELVDKKIDKARDDILSCMFDINPKWIDKDKESTGCQFCKYNDICFMRNEDYVNLKKYKDLSFLEEGDINA